MLKDTFLESTKLLKALSLDNYLEKDHIQSIVHKFSFENPEFTLCGDQNEFAGVPINRLLFFDKEPANQAVNITTITKSDTEFEFSINESCFEIERPFLDKA